MLAKRLAHSPAHDHRRIKAFKRFTHEGLITRAEQEIQWADRGLALIEAAEPERAAAALGAFMAGFGL